MPVSPVYFLPVLPRVSAYVEINPDSQEDVESCSLLHEERYGLHAYSLFSMCMICMMCQRKTYSEVTVIRIQPIKSHTNGTSKKSLP